MCIVGLIISHIPETFMNIKFSAIQVIKKTRFLIYISFQTIGIDKFFATNYAFCICFIYEPQTGRMQLIRVMIKLYVTPYTNKYHSNICLLLVFPK